MGKYPIRILCVFAKLGRGGAETMCMELYRHIDRSKVQFDFVKHYPDVEAYEAEIISLGGNVYTAPTYSGYNHLQYINWWKTHLKNHPEHKIIHGHYFTLSPVYFPVCQKMGRTTIAHSHATPNIEKNFKNFLKRRMNLLIENHSSFCLACSDDAGRSIFKKKKFTVLNNAIEPSRFIYNQRVREEMRSKFNLTDKFVIGHIGRFNHQKNHTFVIDIFEKIKEKQRNAVLVLVGTGSLLKDIKDKVKKRTLDDSVMFLGVRSDVPDLLQMMDVFLFPSLFEGLGIVAVEAQAASLQVVCSDEVPQEAKITNYLEFLPLSCAAELWADNVLKYVDGYPRSNMSEKISAAGYNIHTTSKWVEQFYLAIDHNDHSISRN